MNSEIQKLDDWYAAILKLHPTDSKSNLWLQMVAFADYHAELYLIKEEYESK